MPLLNAGLNILAMTSLLDPAGGYQAGGFTPPPIPIGGASGGVTGPVPPVTLPPGAKPVPSPTPAPSTNWFDARYEKVKQDAARNWNNFVEWLKKWALNVGLLVVIGWLAVVFVTGDNPTPDLSRLNPVVERIRSATGGGKEE